MCFFFATVARWVKIYRDGIEKTKDAQHSRPLIALIVDSIIDLVRNVLEDSPI